jgi:quinoprotein glucose dehydrogenase
MIYRKAGALALAIAFAAVPAAAQEGVSVWSGVFTQEQAERGAGVYNSVCARCHGMRGNGAGDPEMPPAPAVARSAFLSKWDGQSVAALFEYVRALMPTDNPASLSDQQYIDSIAHMLTLSTIEPGGDAELPADSAGLEEIFIEPKPE